MQPAPKAAPPAPAPEQDDFRRRFEHRGRAYTLFKLEPTRDAPFYIHFQRGRRRYKKSTETNVAKAAETNAKLFIDSVFSERWNDVAALSVKRPAATVGEILSVYKDKATCGMTAKRNNPWALRYILKLVKGTPCPDSLLSTELTGDLARRFQDAMLRRDMEEARKEKAEERAARERSLRSSRSILRQARSIFNRTTNLLRYYADAGLTLPECIANEFMKERLQGKVFKREYLAPPDSVVEAAFTSIEKVRETDKDVYLMFWGACGAGLRKSEMFRLDWASFIQRDGEMWISGGIGKDGEKIEIPVQAKAAEKLAPFRKPDGRFIEGNREPAAQRLNDWMAAQGWMTEKKMHELRAYVGSKIYQVNPVAAMKFMRHKSIRVTEQFYCRYSVQSRSVNVL